MPRLLHTVHNIIGRELTRDRVDGLLCSHFITGAGDDISNAVHVALEIDVDAPRLDSLPGVRSDQARDRVLDPGKPFAAYLFINALLFVTMTLSIAASPRLINRSSSRSICASPRAQLRYGKD
jgi:hypothetical protein